MMQKLLKFPKLIRRGMNIWPPFRYSGIKIIELSADYRKTIIELKFKKFNLNANRTQYGGSVFSMTDPVYSLMLMANLGDKYHVWDKSAHIDFISPGQSSLYTTAELSQQVINEIVERTKDGKKYFPVFILEVFDKQGKLVARVERTLYVRLKAKYRP
ncbi:DUF4442 domain-containing protein [Catenovulum agarivorans]|uniref:DUF4442 domain-containing protein n=1 Tax=Catenovulum agarivorans TaxID=1172192 RepID=UPI0002E6BBA1|nr:DUF4442 domain-containing protein [Catenovulum agarivorans]